MNTQPSFILPKRASQRRSLSRWSLSRWSLSRWSLGRWWCAAIAILTAASACVETGSDPVAIPISVAGSDVQAGFEARAGWLVRLEQAELAFGPLTLCAGATAAGLCETAHAEWLGSTVLDALESKPLEVGEIVGIGGAVRSWMYDLGFVSLLARDEPWRTDAARELGASLRVAGTATQGARTLRFTGALDVQQELDTERGIPVVSKTSAVPFEQDLSTPNLALVVRFNARAWFAQLDFDALAQTNACTDGCNVEVEIDPESQAGRALRLALVAGEPPSFTWNTNSKN